MLINSSVQKLYHKVINKTPQDILAEYRTLPENDFQITYNIKLNKDGTIFDKSSNVCYPTLKEWANEVLAQIKQGVNHYE